MPEYKVVNNKGKEIFTDITLHPGEILEAEIDTRKLKKQAVARELGILPGHLSEILKEKRHVSAMLALKLEDVFGISAEYWLRVQSHYDLVKARKKLQERMTKRKTRKKIVGRQ